MSMGVYRLRGGIWNDGEDGQKSGDIQLFPNRLTDLSDLQKFLGGDPKIAKTVDK